MSKYAYGKIRRSLLDCPRCYRPGLVIKIYDSGGIHKRAAFCIRKSCGYRQEWPWPEEYIRKGGGIP